MFELVYEQMRYGQRKMWGKKGKWGLYAQNQKDGDHKMLKWKTLFSMYKAKHISNVSGLLREKHVCPRILSSEIMQLYLATFGLRHCHFED